MMKNMPDELSRANKPPAGGKVFRKLGVGSRRQLARVPLDQANAVPLTHG